MNSNHAETLVDSCIDNSGTNDICTLILAESTGWRFAAGIEVDLALTVLAACSEDPADWSEIFDYWPRYRTPIVSDLAESIPLEPTDPKAAAKRLSAANRWLFIDLVGKRILCSKSFEPVKPDHVFSLSHDFSSRDVWPLSIHLAPWWQLQQPANAGDIVRARNPMTQRPRTDRTFLYGPSLLDELSRQILRASQSASINGFSPTVDKQRRHQLTVQIHRDWLMTARPELRGKTPREHLHGGSKWIENLVQGQRLRLQEGLSMWAAPTDAIDYPDAPMGVEEICIYFDLCRALIDEGWSWVAAHPLTSASSQAKLVEHLSQFQQRWMNEPGESDCPPAVIIEYSRRRVPRAVGEEIIGMPNHRADTHVDFVIVPSAK